MLHLSLVKEYSIIMKNKRTDEKIVYVAYNPIDIRSVAEYARLLHPNLRLIRIEELQKIWFEGTFP